MIIGFDGSRAFVGERTGTENYSFQLLKNLAKIDKTNQYIVYVRPQTVILRNEVTKDLSQMRVPNELGDSSLPAGRRGFAQNDKNVWPKNFQFRVINWPRLWTQGGLALQTFKDKLDVLFVPAHTLPIIKRPGLKTVVVVHDLGSEYLPSMHQVKQRVYLGFMQKYQLQTAAKIIAVSRATKDDLVKKVGIDSGKIEVIYEGYDKNLFKPVMGDALINTLIHYNLQPKTYVSAKQKGKVLPKAGSYYLFVGTVQPRKNLERLIKAFYSVILRTKSEGSSMVGEDSSLIAQNDNLKLVIAGSRGWLSDEIYGLPKKLGIEDRVKFLGYVPDVDLPALYSGAIALTFPSLFEGFGLPILEAQACGCPVLTSNVSSMPEVAGPPPGGGAIFVDPYCVDDIVKGMERLQITDHRLQLTKRGFENVKRFSWEKCARETLRVLLSS